VKTEIVCVTVFYFMLHNLWCE